MLAVYIKCKGGRNKRQRETALCDTVTVEANEWTDMKEKSLPSVGVLKLKADTKYEFYISDRFVNLIVRSPARNKLFDDCQNVIVSDLR